MHKPPISERFLAAFSDPRIFDCGQFNLLKVAQDALLRQVGAGSRRTYFDKPKWLITLYFAFKRFKAKRSIGIESWTQKRVLAVLPPRFVIKEDGRPSQLYLDNLAPYFPEGEPLLMYLHTTLEMPVSPDVDKSMIDSAFGAEKPDHDEWTFIANLNACFRRISVEGTFTEKELKYIKVGLDEFWRNYRAMNRFFAKLQLKRAILVPGYYTEYVIAALKNQGVEVIELQHGVITPASHFYCYPQGIQQVVKRALFADRIWTFGAFWKKQLLRGAGFEENQIEIIGDYFVRAVKQPSQPQLLDRFEAQFTDRVLVGTQTKRHQQFVEMVQELSNRYAQERPNAGIIVKLHPAEDSSHYSDLVKLDNVIICDASLEYLYPRCAAYISMYSNTLFEAARYPNLRIFVLMAEETAAFVQGIAESGVATILNRRDDPLEMPEDGSIRPQANEYFNPTLNKELLDGLFAE